MRPNLEQDLQENPQLPSPGSICDVVHNDNGRIYIFCNAIKSGYVSRNVTGGVSIRSKAHPGFDNINDHQASVAALSERIDRLRIHPPDTA